MTNPYQPPQFDPRSPVAKADLADLPPLRQQIRVLRIIVTALAIGVIVFGVFTIFHNLGRPQALAGKLDTTGLIMLGFGLLCGLQAIILPGILFRFVKPNPAAANQWAVHGPEVARVLAIQSRIQTATIIGCALFEGGAFANLVWYMNTGELMHLAMAGLLLLGILARFPLPVRLRAANRRRTAAAGRRSQPQAGRN